ncbi:MAG: beta-galactosidase, partial [Treponema sp.]|nr:beta-galactosidase [Treponema sp.]
MRHFTVQPEDLYKGALVDSLEQDAVSLRIPAAGGGILLPPLVGCTERYFCFCVEALEDHSVPLELLFHLKSEESQGAGRPPDNSHVSHGVRFGIMPRFPVRIIIDLRWMDGHVLFPGHEAGELKVVWMGGRVEREDLRKVSLEARPSFHDITLKISELCLSDRRPEPCPLPKQKLIDEFGQYKPKDWPGKTRSLGELKTRLEGAFNLPDAYGIPGWDIYGGSTEHPLAPASGFFSTVKKNGRWNLVDPAGNAFFSAGLTCVNVHPDCRIDGLESLVDWLPPRDDPVYQAMYTDRRWPESGFEGRNNCRLFSFAAANLYKIFGEDWREKWAVLITRQLKANGLNTIANWSDPALFGRMPYVTTLGRFPETREKIFRDFPDVLSGEYAEDAERCAAALKQRRDDPWMIGYFLRNEPMWAFVNNIVIADEVLYNPAPTVSKAELIKFLREKYKNPQSLSSAWNHPFSSFDDLRRPLQNASRLSAASRADQREFSRTLLRAYVTIPSRACRKVDPRHMNLGMRWAWISDPDLVSGWENFDVFSINCYSDDPTAALDNVRSLGVDLPVMIGEFHFGALDLGLTATGLKATIDQKGRGMAYRYYCDRVAAHPHGAGCHWFQCYDQFPLGRFDGENYNIGLFDVCSLPNAEMMEAIRACS